MIFALRYLNNKR